MELTRPEVLIEENAPRDGLQNEAQLLSVEERVALIDRLSACGLQRIQIGSFVNARRVPQMADTEKVYERIKRYPKVVYSVLVLNEKGLERALSCGMEHLSVFVSASEAHSRRNANCSVEEATGRAGELIARAKSRGVVVRAGIMNAFGCRLEGAVAVGGVLDLVRIYAGIGVDEINLADTAGCAHPEQIADLAGAVMRVTAIPLSLHLHDTYGFGLANIYAAWKAGVRRFDASCGGLGGCPFIPNAAGNVATEDVVHLLHSMGVTTGVTLEQLGTVVQWLEAKLGRRLSGRYFQTRSAERFAPEVDEKQREE